MVIKRRAITNEQRTRRRQTLLDVAWRLFQEYEYEKISVNDIAKGAGLAKGTVYLYFKTKEEIFLAVQEQQLEVWFDELDDWLQQQSGRGDAHQAAAMICGSLTKRPALARLLAILPVVLEQNIEYETALRFKRMILDRLSKTGTLLEIYLPSLLPGRGKQLMLWLYTLLIGLQQTTTPAPIIREVIAAEPDLASLTLDFCSECEAIITVLFSGAAFISQGAKK